MSLLLLNLPLNFNRISYFITGILHTFFEHSQPFAVCVINSSNHDIIVVLLFLQSVSNLRKTALNKGNSMIRHKSVNTLRTKCN